MSYHRSVLVFRPGALDTEDRETCKGIQEQLSKRLRYANVRSSVAKTDNIDALWQFVDGVAQFTSSSGKKLINLPSIEAFHKDLQELFDFSNNGAANTITFRRLKLLEYRFDLYRILNSLYETELTKFDPQDFDGVFKVDNHLHLDASYTASELASFIRNKLKECPNDVVGTIEGKDVTLKETFDSLGMSVDNITIDSLGATNDERLFHRFDQFNASYNPFGNERLRTVFMSPSNLQKGKYFAELIGQVFDRNKALSRNCLMEPRLTLFGRNLEEWTELASWVCDNNLLRPEIRWMVQIPRLYGMFREKGLLQNFHQMNANTFIPLFEATLYPEKYPKLAIFLEQVVAFDSVDDESRPDELHVKHPVSPEKWANALQPPYSYYLYYLWANLAVLNALRAHKGLNTFALRPHCGESGPVHHLCTGFLLGQSINHGILLNSNPTLQYLYYLAQVGLSMSPVSNNVLFRTLDRNPFGSFFKRGLNVTLGTDDPLQFHSTRSPLLEEYTIAKHFWKLSVTDLCEIARNSVLQSGWSVRDKQRFIGEHYQSGMNDSNKTNIPDCRVFFRNEMLMGEYQYVMRCIVELPPVPTKLQQSPQTPPGQLLNWQLIANLDSRALPLPYAIALSDYNLPSPLSGSVPDPSHLTTHKGEYVTVLFDSGKSDLVLCMDQSGYTGFMPRNTLALVTPTTSSTSASTSSSSSASISIAPTPATRSLVSKL